MPKHVLKGAIHPLSLSICLRMVGGGQALLGPQNLQECCHKLAGETWVSITHNCLWATVVLEDMIHIKSSRLLPSQSLALWWGSGVSSLTACLPPQAELCVHYRSPAIA